ncbi:rubrerythrin family protein [Neobacillus piezotolerans]|uniref:Rubrerythrin family protein n=1 Tax=Neobacillus piezotolerans TaxID=2259171 RepID=A0A3D8GQT2_9BACI|nr:ferritin-like domain-containing protein [Neobacillus piezotolerans]RDU36843.1 rubrerythrin family protein [Neobacillus piezotolerans]
MENETVIKELNAFLKGQYMGIRAYEHLIERLDDQEVKTIFQGFQQDHRLHAAIVAERIQNLGGVPENNEGLVGKIQGFMSEMMMPKDTEGIVKLALKGEDVYGIQLSEEIVKGDLDPESRKMVESILDTDRRHVTALNNLVH